MAAAALESEALGKVSLVLGGQTTRNRLQCLNRDDSPAEARCLEGLEVPSVVELLCEVLECTGLAKHPAALCGAKPYTLAQRQVIQTNQAPGNLGFRRFEPNDLLLPLTERQLVLEDVRDATHTSGSWPQGLSGLGQLSSEAGEELGVCTGDGDTR